MRKIEVRNVCKKFDELEVLKGIDMTVDEGEVVAIIGPSGGGKSTFLRCLNKLETICRKFLSDCLQNGHGVPAV